MPKVPPGLGEMMLGEISPLINMSLQRFLPCMQVLLRCSKEVFQFSARSRRLERLVRLIAEAKNFRVQLVC